MCILQCILPCGSDVSAAPATLHEFLDETQKIRLHAVVHCVLDPVAALFGEVTGHYTRAARQQTQ